MFAFTSLQVLQQGHPIEDGRLVLSPARPRYSLAELLDGMKPGDMPTAKGWSDARPAGREAG